MLAARVALLEFEGYIRSMRLRCSLRDAEHVDKRDLRPSEAE